MSSLIILLLATSSVALITLISAWRRRHLPGAVQFIALMFFVMFWTLTSALEHTVSTAAGKIWASKLQYFSITNIPPLWLLFTLNYTHQKRWITRRNILLSWIIPILTILAVMTNEWHGLIWSRITPETNAAGSLVLQYAHGAWFWIIVSYSYIFLLSGSIALARAVVLYPDVYRNQLVVIFLAVAFPWVGNLIYVFGLSPLPGVDLTPIGLTITGVLMNWGIYRYHIMDLVPVARDAIIENMLDGVIVLDNLRRVADINPKAIELFALHGRSVVGENAEKAFAFCPELLESLEGIADKVSEAEIHVQTDPIRHIDLTISPLFNSQRQSIGHLIVLRDTTTRRTAEAQLVRSEERFRRLLSAAPDPMLIFNDQGVIVMTNTAAVNVFGWTAQELVGKTFTNLIPQRYHQNIAYIQRTFFNVTATRPVGLDKINFCLRKDGDEFPVEVTIAPLQTEEGRIILASVRDITYRREAERQLRLLSTALEAAASAVLISDTEGKIIWVNPAFTDLTGYTLEEVIGKTPRILNSGEHPSAYFQKLWETILAGKVWEGEIINRHKDGSLYTEEQTIAPVLDESGKLRFFVAVKTDISERKQLEKMREDLTNAIVHDLRNPLTATMVSLDMIGLYRNGSAMLPEQREMIDIAQTNIRLLANLVNTILDISKLESGKMPINREAIILSDLTEQVLALQAPLAERKEILLLNGVKLSLPPIEGDSVLIGRVIQNLVDNAIKFTPEGETIEIIAQPSDDQEFMVISVRDNGPGIPPEMRDQLFQKFSAGSTKGRGTGLGLAFCKLVVENHEGKIWAENAPEGGTVFSFTLPLAS